MTALYIPLNTPPNLMAVLLGAGQVACYALIIFLLAHSLLRFLRFLRAKGVAGELCIFAIIGFLLLAALPLYLGEVFGASLAVRLGLPAPDLSRHAPVMGASFVGLLIWGGGYILAAEKTQNGV